jgi:hypothetical protein
LTYIILALLLTAFSGRPETLALLEPILLLLLFIGDDDDNDPDGLPA